MFATHHIAVAAAVLALASDGAAACSVAGGIDTPTQLVSSAEGIYRVRTDGYRGPVPMKRGEIGRIQVVVIERLKGPLLEKLTLDGVLTEADDPNDRPVPYDFVRPAGRHGNCFALDYTKGKEFLLFLKGGTPYWSALAPTNEQIDGATDSWVAWVKRQLAVGGAP